MLAIKFYSVYFVSNFNNNVLYIGVTNNLFYRTWQHKIKYNPTCFTAKYNAIKLVYFEEYESILSAIAREKQLKNWKREWKNKLVESINPEWKDLAKDWYTEDELNFKVE